jgi:hypothetical protein
MTSAHEPLRRTTAWFLPSRPSFLRLPVDYRALVRRAGFPGTPFVHVITHSTHHRAQALYIMEHLGLTDLPEGDPLDWEHKAFGWRSG